MPKTLSNNQAETMDNRASFFRHLDNEINRCQMNNQVLGLLLVKVLRIYDINATFGYQTGDELLLEITGRIKSLLRPKDIISHIAHNEFALILPDIHRNGHSILAATRIKEELKKPVFLNGNNIVVKINIGIAEFPDYGYDAESLTSHADIALRHAKSSVKDYEIYSPIDFISTKTNILLENELNNALENCELCLYIQPQIDLKQRTVSGAEVLSRWDSPTQGTINPEEFIEIAEKNGLIHTLTRWSLNAGLRHCAQFREINNNFSLAVNLSPVLLHDHELVELVTSSMTIWGIEPGGLILEVTEGAMMIDPVKSLETLHRLNEAGIHISIDDFGTGHSSLTYLKELPVSELKIDKSFVMNMMNDKKDASIVRSIIDLAHNFDLTVVAEGIEDQKTMDELTAMGCDYGQGYYLSKPMKAEEMEEWMLSSFPKKFSDNNKL